ncbi:cytochrome c oxidase-assembly factor COX23, mitochondrial [Paracoccidioides brasiliensis Pb03]|nr:cytochrome c oxidase-assembly factor COX23, mitochondrial [Paracoccidioides brasiliensis Pb03]
MDADKVKEEPQSAWEKAKPMFTNKPASGYYDPCQDFADRSIKCMRRNDNDKTMCSDYFQAYRDCKKEWMTQRKKKS